jgi:L-iditol 2-dehydrogenase
VTLEAAAMLEPLSVAIHATRRASIQPGDTAIVFGAGAVGLLTAAMAQVCGATNVLIADLDEGRVAYALKNRFATKGYVVSLPEHEDSTEERIQVAKDLAEDVIEKLTAGKALYDDYEGDLLGADIVFDCTGKEVCVQAGLFVCLAIHLVVIHDTNLNIGSTPRSKTSHGRNGNADPDLADVCCSLQGG